MSDDPFSSLPSPSASQGTQHKKKKSSFWLLVILLLGVGFIALTFSPWYMRMYTPAPAENNAQTQQRLTGLENSVRAINERVDALSSLSSETKTSDVSATSATTKQSASDIARLQSDLVALSSALTALQNEVKESSSHALHSQQTTQSTLAAAIAYMQLRVTAESNQPFTAELSAMREASTNDSDFQLALAKLQPIAATGAPILSELQQSLLTQEASAAQAIDRQKAQNSWDKLMVELKGLVSIRRLHGGATDAFSAMENDLSKNDLSAVLEDIKHLPVEAQTVLNDWRTQVEARQTVNDALHALANHFNDLAKTHTTQGVP